MRNRELQSILIKVTLFQLLLWIVLAILANNYTNRINTAIVEQNQALAGNLLLNHPNLEEEIITYITKDISDDKIKEGKETLKKYGYTMELNKSDQPLFNNISPSIQTTISIVIVLCSLILIFIINSEYNQVYKKVRILYEAAEKVVEGEFNVHLDDRGEGEFNILNHQFNQMANRLENSLDTLKNEKVFLKNTISDISHQLKTPLSSLIMLNDLMLEHEEMEDLVRITFLEKSKIQLERMEWLIINLLKLARIEAGAIQFKKEKVYLKDIAVLAIETLSPKCDTEHISIEISNDLNGIFYGDKEWTTEALINILKNSIEHNKENQKIKIIIEETFLFSSITIKDYGQGIDDKDLPHIFKRFYKGSSRIDSDSIGIGLNLAKLIVESQNGSISVKSKEGEGTSFTISFLKDLYNLTKN